MPWIAVLICATLLAVVPAAAGLTAATPEGTSAAVAAQAIPVILDPASGRQIAVWSVSDGVSNKIAYARLDGGVWTDFHFLTFGRGHDTEPRVAVTRDGAFLFWIADGQRYLYAPLDLASGRLYAAPRGVPLESAGLRIVRSRTDLSTLNGVARGGSYGSEGGVDVPVVTDLCPANDPDCESQASVNRLDPRHQILTESGGASDPDGGVDVPVVSECPPEDENCEIVHGSKNDQRQPIVPEGGSDVPVVSEAAPLWSVSSRPTCNLMILSIPSVEPGVYHLLRFESGRLGKTGLIRLLPGDPGGRPTATAEPILDAACF